MSALKKLKIHHYPWDRNDAVRHQPPIAESYLLWLPDDVLEILVRKLDGFSLIAFTLCDWRFQMAVARMSNNLGEMAAFEGPLRNSMPVAANVRSLDFSHRHEQSPALEGVILACPEVKDLKILNTSLEFKQIMKILGHLGKLDNMSFSLDELPEDSSLECRTLKAQGSIRKLFVDCNGSVPILRFLAQFLNKCRSIEYVHINFLGCFPLPAIDVPYPFPRKSPRCRSLQTMVGSFLLTKPETRLMALKAFLDFCEPMRQQCFTRHQMEFVSFPQRDLRGFPVSELVVTKKIDELRTKYDAPPLVLHRLPMPDRYRWPVDLVNLDLTIITTDFTEADWAALVDHSPNLRTIGCHLCFLPVGIWFSQMRADTPAQPSYVVQEVAVLRLIKWHVLFGIVSLFGAECVRCVAHQFRYILGDFARLRHLEEFTLVGAVPSPVMYEELPNSTITVLKLCLRESPEMQGLHEMLLQCPRLRYFKFEAPNLPLYCPELWRALALSQPFKQLCVASESATSIDLDVIRWYLPDLMGTGLEVFHLHADKQPALYDLIYNYVNFVNRVDRKNIHMLNRGIASLSGRSTGELSWKIPGRNLCSTALLIGKMDLDGWSAA